MRSHWRCPAGLVLWLCGGLFALCTAHSGNGQDKPPPKAAAPNAAAQAKARNLIQAIFRDGYAAAQKSDAARRSLALKVFAESKVTREDAALRFGGLLEARDLAAAIGDLRLVFSVIDELNKHYLIDLTAMRLEALQKAAKEVNGEIPLRQVIEVTLRLVGEVVAADKFDAAKQLLAVADEAAIRSKSLKLVSRVAKRTEQVESLVAEHQRVQPALDKLKTLPNDPEANQTAGNYFALTRGNRERGLPLLARGSDALLKALAKRDRAGPKNAREQMSLAEDWAELHKSHKDPAKSQLLLRAVHWYRLALDKTEGLRHRYVETEIKTLTAQVAHEFQPTFFGFGAPLADVAVMVHALNGHTDNVMGVTISPDGRRAASASWDRSIRIWDLTTVREVQRLDGHTQDIESICWSPNGQLLLSCGQDATVRLWDTQTAREVRQFIGHKAPVFQVTFSPDGTRALTAAADGTVRLWDVPTGNELAKLTGHRGGVNRVAFSPDGRQAVSGGADLVVRLWDLEARREVAKLAGHTLPIWSVAFSPEGDKVASASNDKTIRVWDVANAQEYRKLTGHKSAVVSLAFAGDGRKLVSGGDDATVRVWEVDTGKEVRLLTGHTGGVYGLAIAPDGQQIVTGGMDKSVRVWRVTK